MAENNSNTLNILHEEWSPRFEGFRPPMWPIFRWAYKIKRTLLMNCIPISMGTNTNDGTEQVSICFTAGGVNIPNELQNSIEQHLSEVLDEKEGE